MSSLKILNNKAGFTQLLNALRSRAGFTIVETMTTVFVFTVLVTTISAIFTRSIDIERRAFSAQVIQESALAVLEVMAKEIRVGTIDSQNNNCTTDPVLTQLTLVDNTGNTITYRLNGDGIVEKVVNGTDIYFLSYNEVRFNVLRFCVRGSTLPFDEEPTRVTVITSISNRTGREVLTVNLQTTIVSREVTNELLNL